MTELKWLFLVLLLPGLQETQRPNQYTEIHPEVWIGEGRGNRSEGEKETERERRED